MGGDILPTLKFSAFPTLKVGLAQSLEPKFKNQLLKVVEY